MDRSGSPSYTSAVEIQEQKRRVPRDFDRIARTYDFLTGANPGYVRHLEMSAARLADALSDADVKDAAPDRTRRVLDLCCGTGLSTGAMRKAFPRAKLVGLDASEGMITKARTKTHLDAEFILGDATDPVAAGAEGPFDAILMAYGIRNIPDPDRCLANLFALLAPGGHICFHEYSVADSLKSRAIWNAVSVGVIIPGGLFTAGSTKIYRYLRRSVNEFDGKRGFERRLLRAGFRDVHTLPLDGWQREIVHSFMARKPTRSQA